MADTLGGGDGEKTLSLDDIVREEQEAKELEAEARAVLGSSDTQNCTWEKGYVERQALYACLTCRPDVKDPSSRAGICLACSYQCHDGHELVELYTKRNFRCDCGNSKFGNDRPPCKLNPAKGEKNEKNEYNQNFDGVYCTCHRPYPDDEDDVEDEMIQCVLCEDWFHSRHLIAPNIRTNFHEMVCHLCVSLHPFLLDYAQALGENDQAISSESTCIWGKIKIMNAKTTIEQNKDNPLDQVSDTETMDKCAENPDLNDSASVTHSSESKIPSDDKTALFFDKGWRSALCKCHRCLDMYREGKVFFITLESDSVEAYEAGSSNEGGEDGEQALDNLLGGMDRFQQGELIAGFQDMKSHLKDYLQKFAENGKVVRAEDIQEFFQDMESRKRQRGNPQYFCG